MIRSPVFAIVLAICLAIFLPSGMRTVSAHEHVTVGGYELIVGWRGEPAVTGAVNGLDLGILNGTGAPVLGAETNLTAVLSMGTASVPKDLDPQFGRPGWYTFDVIPTREGAYSVHLAGTLGTTAVNVDVALDDVGPASALASPVADPTASELQARLDTVQSILIVAIGLAVIGLAVGALGLASARRTSRIQGKVP